MDETFMESTNKNIRDVFAGIQSDPNYGKKRVCFQVPALRPFILMRETVLQTDGLMLVLELEPLLQTDAQENCPSIPGRRKPIHAELKL